MKKITEKINKSNYIDKITHLLLPLTWLVIIVVCFFIFAFTSHASSTNSDAPLPYIVSNENTDGWEDFVNGMIYNGNYSWAVSNINNDNYFGYDFYENGHHYFAFYFPADDFEYEITLSNNDYNTFSMTTNSMLIEFRNYTFVKAYHVTSSNGRHYIYGSQSSTKITTTESVRFFVGSNKGNGNLLVPNLASQNYLYEDDEYQVVFGFGNPERPLVPTGHATPPPENVSPEYQTGHARPDYVPTPPSFNSYSWTTYTPATVDTSSVETLIQSEINTIKSIIEWLAENIHGIIENLSDNIYQGLIFIGKCVIYYGDLIIDNIQNMIKTFYDNMVSLFENMGNTVTSLQDMINEPLNASLLSHQLSNSSFITAWRTTKSEITGFFGKFSDVSQPENVIFEIDLSDLWLDMGVSYIDFSILSPVLPFIRLVLGAILLYELIVTIVTSINAYIGGNSSKNDG